MKLSAVLISLGFITVSTAPAMGDQIMVNLSVTTVLSMGINSTSLNLGSISPGQPKTGTTTITVSTNSQSGYQINGYHSSLGFTNTLRHTNEVDYIPDKPTFDGTPDTTALWSGVGFGFTVYSATEKDTAIWGTGTTDDDLNNRYSGFPDVSRALNTVHTNVQNDQTKVGYKVDVSNAQEEGSYAGDVTYDATIIP